MIQELELPEPPPVLRLLHVEDDPADAEFAQELLSEAKECRFEILHAADLRTAMTALEQDTIDAIVLDLSLPDSTGTEAVKRLRPHERPIVVFTDAVDPRLRLEAIREGAQDVICKDDPVARLLARSVLYALERHHAEQRRRQIEELREDLDTVRAERKSLENQFLQSQKMEAVGRLAGGVAHDFNNLLTVILGNLELLRDGVGHDSPLSESLGVIQSASEQAATLTRQLLAFSRRQVMEAHAVDLNDIVAGTERMLRRILGENIAIELHLCRTAGRVLADPGQLEQVLMNLVVNARDAMPDGGMLTIRTENTTLDEGRSYVVVEVTDNGVGMDEETQLSIFDPFFTTKEPGKGTGLGLSSVYGIVKQNGGFIQVDSEVGRGATFKIYLPQVPQDAAPPLSQAREVVPRGTETVLVVEDDPAVRLLACRWLERQGYRVLEAPDGAAGLRIVESHRGPIHLVVSDVMMPNLGGPAMVERLRQTLPDVRVLFVSGYPQDTAFSDNLQATCCSFLQKPFTHSSLAAKVRELLALSV